MIQKIVVVGGTGMLGTPVVKKLIAAGFQVSVLARNAAKATELFPEATIFSGDLQDESSLQKALAGQDAAYVNLSVTQEEKRNSWHAEKEGLTNFLKAAKAANLQRIGFISSMVMDYQGTNGFNWWVFDVKKEAVAQVKKADIPYFIFYPSAFMETLVQTQKQGNKIMLAGKARAKMHYVAGDDYGNQVVKAFKSNPTGNKEYYIQGPEAFTGDEAAAILVANYKREKLKIMKAPLGMLRFLGNFSQKMNYGAHIIEALNNYPEEFKAEKAWAELGKPTITIKAFAERQ